MEILILGGTEQKLYELVAPLVMNPAIIRQNNNYPFKTLPKYIWHVAIEGDEVLGFIPLKPLNNGYCIDNYYIKGDDKEIIASLLRSVIGDISSKFQLTGIINKRHVPYFAENDFKTFLELKNYDKMEYLREHDD